MATDMMGSPAAISALQGKIVAWVNFNGSGGATIRGSLNVRSVVRNSTGNYTVTFIDPIVDDLYLAIPTVDGFGTVNAFAQTSTQRGNDRYKCVIQVVDNSNAVADGAQIGLVVIR